MSRAASAAAALGGAVLLCWALALTILDSTDILNISGQSSSVSLQKAPARRTAAQDRLEVERVIPDPDGSGKEDFVYREPDGTEVDSNVDGKRWEREIKWKEKMAERKHHELLPMVITLAIHVAFAIFYKIWVVDMIPPLSQRPISVDEDFRQDIFAACTTPGQGHLCLHATFCCQCRAAHTWHVAGICEYWPALLLLFIASWTKCACCIDSFVYTYFRMRLKEKLGIRSNLVMDLLYSMFCPCCAVAQEAMAIDSELGTNVECCCQLLGGLAIGSVDRMDRGNVIQLVHPELDNNDFDNNRDAPGE